ncbi:unnamed protein product, partial [Choristocarpus tenellus]
MQANPEIKEAAMKEMFMRQKEMEAVFKKYKTGPFAAFSSLVQLPVFISLFLGCRQV